MVVQTPEGILEVRNATIRANRLEADSFRFDSNLHLTSNLEVGTANLFVDTTTSNVGIGTNLPLAKLHVNGTFYAHDAIRQIVQSVKTDTSSTNSTSFIDTGVSVTITPKTSTSKILISYSVNAGVNNGHGYLRLVRDGTPIAIGDAAGSRYQCTHAPRGDTHNQDIIPCSMEFLDVPATTSAVTYKIQMAVAVSVYYIYINRNHSNADSVYSGRTASTITAKEIGY